MIKKVVLLLLSVPLPVFAFDDYTPLISADSFDGIRTDVLTTAGGLISVVLVVVGLGILIRTLGK